MTYRATMLLCTCGRPTPESSYLCVECRDDLGRALGDVPALAAELEVTLARQRRFETQSDGSRSTTDALPFDIAASNALHELHNELVGLVRLCIEADVSSRDYQSRGPGDTLSSMSSWLMWRVDGMSALPYAADTLRLVQIARHCEHVIDRPPDRTFAGPCDECGRDLYAIKGESSVHCAECGIEYELASRREWLLRVVDDQLATATEIARALTSLDVPIKAERIWQWKRRERIDTRGHDKRGHPLFRVGDVLALLNEQRDRDTKTRSA
jgi:hypothetical protein